MTTFAVLSATIGASLVASPVLALTPTSVTVSVDPPAPTEDVGLTINATVTPVPPPSPAACGHVNFVEDISGTPTQVLSLEVCGTASTTSTTWPVGYLAAGQHTWVATFVPWDGTYAESQSDPLTFTMAKASSTTYIAQIGNGPPEANSPIRIDTWVISGMSGQTGGSASIYRSGVATALCVLPITTNTQQLTCMAPALPAGTYTFYSVYSGTSKVLGSQSSNLSVNVVADTIHATGVGLQYTTFYPVTDGYEDGVAIRGTRNEPISVSIKIYSPAGSLLKSVAIPSGTGAYSYGWYGRNSAGTIYAEGRYRVVQVLRDAAGTTYTQTVYLTLSKKKLYSYSATITKYGSSVTAKGTALGGTITLSSTSHYAKLVAPSTGSSWAGAGWELTLPSATIYKSFYVKVYGRHSGATGYTALGAQNFGTCAYVASATWNEGCFSAWKQIATTSGTTLHTYGTAALSSAYRHGNRVRLIVSSYGGTTYIYKAQVYVTYGILKY
jgi:hypothetical protein